MFNDDMNSENSFTLANINFEKDVEISKILSTSIYHHIQIVAKDAVNNVMIIVTWDCDNNIEASMF